MRKGEILSLTWDNVDLHQGFINLEAEDTKDNEPRRVPISVILHKILSKLPREINNHHVFLYNRKPISDIRAALKRGCEQAGIPYGRFSKGVFIYHDLRHTFNTHMRKAGVPESVLMEITGHSTREMFDRYNTVDMDDSRKAVDQMEVFLQNVDQTVDQGKKNTFPKEG